MSTLLLSEVLDMLFEKIEKEEQMKKQSNRSLAAKKANDTRRKLDRIEEVYGEDTRFVVKALLSGSKKNQAEERQIRGLRRFAAIKANFTRGAYDHILGMRRFQ